MVTIIWSVKNKITTIKNSIVMSIKNRRKDIEKMCFNNDCNK